MHKLINFSTGEQDLNKFDSDPYEMRSFLEEHRLDGMEIIQHSEWNENIIPSALIRGLHMRYWPAWLDFWKGDKLQLKRQFGDNVTWMNFYGGSGREALVDFYRREADVAQKIGVKYLVFHIAHVELEHCYNYNFTYSDYDVIEAGIEMVNLIFRDEDPGMDLLFENLWWPGLNLLDRKAAGMLMEGVLCPRKGIMLDTGHLMNTDLDLKNEEEAVKYILSVLEGLGEITGFIKGIHLNSSVSGQYVKEQISKNRLLRKIEGDYFKNYFDAYGHILKIDRHLPFRHEGIKEIIDYINPRYLVYEFLPDSRELMEQYVRTQNEVLSRT